MVKSPPRVAATLLALAAYAVVLHWTFQVKVAPVFAYLGARYREADQLNYLLVFFALMLVAMTLPTWLDRPSDGVLWVLFVTLGVPAALVPQYMLILDAGRSLILGLMVCATFGVISVLSRYGPLDGRLRFRVPPPVVWWGISLFSFVTYAYVSATFGLSVETFSLDRVRDLRFDYRDTIASSGPLLAYLIRYQGSVLNPLLMAAGVLHRRWWLIGAGALGQAVLFSATGYKLFFLSIPTVVAVTWLLQRRPQHAGRTVLIGVLAASLAAIAIDRLRGGPILWIEVFVDRMLIVPGMLTAAYVQVFEDRPKYLFGSFLPFGDSAYTLSPGFYVAAAFSGNPDANANAGFLGDGYAQYGYIGVLIEAFGVLLILWGVNATGRHLPVAITFPLLLLPTLSLGNVSPFTTLQTGGFAFAFALMAMLPQHGWERSPMERRPERPRQPA